MKYTTRLLVTSRTSERRRRMKTFETCIFKRAESCRPSCYCRRPTSIRILHATQVATARCRFWLRRGKKPALAESQRRRWIKQHARLLGEEEILICPAQSLLFSFPIFFWEGGVVVVCHYCCQGGSSSQAPCLPLPVFVFNGESDRGRFYPADKETLLITDVVSTKRRAAAAAAAVATAAAAS